jgi:hypothetical protein
VKYNSLFDLVQRVKDRKIKVDCSGGNINGNEGGVLISQLE